MDWYLDTKYDELARGLLLFGVVYVLSLPLIYLMVSTVWQRPKVGQWLRYVILALHQLAMIAWLSSLANRWGLDLVYSMSVAMGDMESWVIFHFAQLAILMVVLSPWVFAVEIVLAWLTRPSDTARRSS